MLKKYPLVLVYVCVSVDRKVIFYLIVYQNVPDEF